MSKLFSAAVKTTLACACAYTTYDATSDGLMYLKATHWIQDALKENPDFVKTLHTEEDTASPVSVTLGPWYDASVVMSHEGMIATVIVPCRGTRQASDITVKAIRRGGVRSTLVYNIVDGSWDVMGMTAQVGINDGRTMAHLISRASKASE